MKSKLLYITAIFLSASLFISSCQERHSSVNDASSSEGAVVADTEIAWEYIDSFIFIGESTTYHMKSRKILSDGSNTLQIWSPKSGTLNLDHTTASVKIIFPETNEEITIGEAAKRKHPKRVLLTFGLNGAVTKIKKGKKYFSDCYLSLIDEIRSNSPETEIILHSCYPISDKMDVSNYSVDAKVLNEYLKVINIWTSDIAANNGFKYLNSWELMTDVDGFLRNGLDVGDGIHLTEDAYFIFLKKLSTLSNMEGS